MKTEHYFKIMKRLPKKLIYYAALQLICEATTGEFSNTIVPELSAMDAVGRFEKMHKLFKER